jgi:hypothetical protein
VRPRRFAALIIASAVRAASVYAFAAQVVAVAATAGPLDWATWRRFDLGWRFWMDLGGWNALLAFACLIPNLALAVSWHNRQIGENVKDTRWCVGLNIATIALLYFVPALAVSR